MKMIIAQLKLELKYKKLKICSLVLKNNKIFAKLT
jgi:hypothetical protein